MRKHIIHTAALVALIFFLSSCKVQVPQFKGIQNIKLQKVGAAGVEFNSEAVFHNPNPVWLKVNNMAIEVLLDKKNVATIGKKDAINVAPKAEFRIPISGAVNTQGTLLDNFNSILQMFLDKEVNVALKGDIKFRAYCILKYHVPIKYEQKLKLNSIISR